MKKLYSSAILVLIACCSLFSQNAQVCGNADPFCSGIVYSFPLSLNTPPEIGPDYGCLMTQPNPVWYFARIGQPGDIIIRIESPTGNDVDFAAWGPYSNPVFPCQNQLTTNCTNCPNNTSDSTFYPSGNMVDCSYDPAYFETIYISNALVGEFYMLMITNYSNAAGDITFSQTNLGQPGAGETDCSFLLNQYLNGTVYLDQNSNNIMDAGEVGLGGAIVYINGCFGAMTQMDGTYAIYNCDSADVIQITLPTNMNVLSVTPQQQTIVSGQSVYDFAVVLDTTPEVSVSLTHYGPLWVNAGSNYLLNVSNNCGSFISGSYQLVLDSSLSFVSSSIPYTSANGQVYEWDFTDLPPLSYINNTITVLSDSLLLDSTYVYSSATVQTSYTELNMANNTDDAAFYINASYDPNFIENSPSDILSQSFVNSSEYIEYTIHFQNTGSAPANKVRILNPISQYLIKPSFELVCSSHQCDVIYNPDGSLVFLFNEINLPAASVNEAGSHGFVTYRMRCNSGLQIDEVINNTADIFFDFNTPVTTNTTENYLTGTHVSIGNVNAGNLSVFPVPSGDFVNIKSSFGDNKGKLVVATTGGTVLFEDYTKGEITTLDVRDYKKGVYIIKLVTAEKVLLGKMVVN